MRQQLRFAAAFTGALLGGSALAGAETLTIATVNNADMIIMQRLSPKWSRPAATS
jgi:sorbitol/mannitol transport system substrate-binding protein